jgi:ABC-type polysaccharide transport system permease subunit
MAFYENPNIWVPILVFTYIWKGVGYNLIVYLAVITGFDKEIYEASSIDGAGRVRQITSMTLPMLVPTIITLTLLSIGRIFFGDFQLIYAIIGNSHTILYERLDIIETYLFRMVTGTTPEYGMLGAVGLFQSVLGFICIFGSNILIKRYNKDYALF